ncbi:hypothetical protein ILYODFUR_025547 [Ilyodon furcidens]|uniref:Uncharacterized protein n=1 Tax=Ilyodon furcidens TaxID=33524 RepID=A0ABV0VH46_9TELE
MMSLCGRTLIGQQTNLDCTEMSPACIPLAGGSCHLTFGLLLSNLQVSHLRMTRTSSSLALVFHGVSPVVWWVVLWIFSGKCIQNLAPETSVCIPASTLTSALL